MIIAFSLISAIFVSPTVEAQFRSLLLSRPIKKVVFTAALSGMYPPVGAKRALVKMWGAGGGAGGNSGALTGGTGGGGAFASMEIDVTGLGPGQGYVVRVGVGGLGGLVVSSSGYNSGKGGSGGGASMILDTNLKNPLLIAGGGGGGGGAMTYNGGAGGGGGFDVGQDGMTGCNVSNCVTAGKGAVGGASASPGINGDPINPTCPNILGLGYIAQPSAPGTLGTDSSVGDGGGDSGTCYITGYKSYQTGAGGKAYYDTTNPSGCSSGSGGGGRAGGGGGGVSTQTNVSCAGGGGGAGFYRTSLPMAVFKRFENGSYQNPGNTADSDYKAYVAGASTSLPGNFGSGGAPSSSTNGSGGNGSNGLVIVYFY